MGSLSSESKDPKRSLKSLQIERCLRMLKESLSLIGSAGHVTRCKRSNWSNRRATRKHEEKISLIESADLIGQRHWRAIRMNWWIFHLIGSWLVSRDVGHTTWPDCCLHQFTWFNWLNPDKKKRKKEEKNERQNEWIYWSKKGRRRGGRGEKKWRMNERKKKKKKKKRRVLLNIQRASRRRWRPYGS